MKSKDRSSIDNQGLSSGSKGFNFSNIFDKNRSSKFLFVFLIIVIVSAVIYKNYNQRNIAPEINKASQNEDTTGDAQRLVCDRTTRLENDENIDRALSLISERLQHATGRELFPPQLINCIKVEVKNIRNKTGAEGYFDGNDENIKSNYFPIAIDDWGSFFADDLSTALLLVHEITHVQQYIDKYNASIDPNYPEVFRVFHTETKGHCLRDEVYAFKNQLMFTLKLKEEEKKSINYRILADENLIPQLHTLKSLKESFSDFSFAERCDEKYDIDCINSGIYVKIYDLLRDSGAYDEQCSVYEGTFIGE